MTWKERMQKLLEICIKEEEKYEKFAGECMNKNNLFGMSIHNAEASVFTRMRWTIEDMLFVEGKSVMEFNVAYNLMKKGVKIKLPEWEGYWYWDEKKNTIMIHTKEGKELDIKESEDMDFTMKNICREDWIEAN